ncbi:MAG: hypothetical protein KDM63_11510 [Verrucomicrobiae bacterium]|nr:hypothetical protein [Verrucomicrobiae bacterium]
MRTIHLSLIPRQLFSFCWGMLCLILINGMAADSPQLIPFQGTLMNPAGEAYPDGQYTITFALYDEPIGGTAVWIERHVKVGVIGGTVNVFLGSLNPFLKNDWSDSTDFGTTKYLGITVDADGDASTPDQEMYPRQLVITCFYAPTTDKIQGYGWDMLFGNQDPSTSAISLTKIPTFSLEKLPQILGNKLEQNLVRGLLEAEGQSVVAKGGVIMSETNENADLLGGGYESLGFVFVKDSWRRLPDMPLDPRYGFASVWTGSELLIWGGYSNGQDVAFADGARYNPSANTWAPMAPADPDTPSARQWPWFTWTGQELVVWGGNNAQSNPLNDGAVYDPDTDTWEPLPASPLSARMWGPLPQNGGQAVWTGTHMVIWGGATAVSNYANDGALLGKNSGTWQWQLMSPNNSPPARRNYAMSWTGNRVFVWGGIPQGGGGTNTGGLYDPVGDIWTATSALNAPSARNLPVAAWTGNEIFVWGGVQSGTYLNNGGRFNPDTNVWSTIPIVGGPSGRAWHSLTWVGSDLVVWGGQTNGDVVLGDGALYSNINDGWNVISNDGAPSKRFNSSAVWSGKEVYFVGGRGASNSADLQDAWAYAPPRYLYLYRKL